jgi:glutathione S-transferase
MLTLYHFPTSPCAGKVRAVLAEKNLKWTSVIVNIIEKENLTKEYLKIHPKGVVPALVDDDKVVIESTIMMEYLDTQYPDVPLKPSSAYGQAKMRKWTKWVDETLHLNGPGFGWTILIRPYWLKKSNEEIKGLLDKLIDPARRDRQTGLLAQGFESPEFVKSMEVFDATLTDMEISLSHTPWLAGDALSLADIAMLPYLSSAEQFGLSKMFVDRPGVRDWFKQWKERPSFAAPMPWELTPAEMRVVDEKSEPIWARLKTEAAA